MIIAGQREFCQAGCLEVADVVDTYVVPDGKLQQLRNVESEGALADRQERQFIPYILSALSGQFATNDALPESVGHLIRQIGGTRPHTFQNTSGRRKLNERFRVDSPKTPFEETVPSGR